MTTFDEVIGFCEQTNFSPESVACFAFAVGQAIAENDREGLVQAEMFVNALPEKNQMKVFSNLIFGAKDAVHRKESKEVHLGLPSLSKEVLLLLNTRSHTLHRLYVELGCSWNDLVATLLKLCNQHLVVSYFRPGGVDLIYALSPRGRIAASDLKENITSS